MSGTPAKLKALQTQICRSNEQLSELDKKQEELDRERHQVEQEKRQLEIQLQKLWDREELLVSEHAMLRYLERVRGIDLEKVKEEILNDEIVSLAAELKFADADIPTKTGGFKVRIKERTIVTILTRG